MGALTPLRTSSYRQIPAACSLEHQLNYQSFRREGSLDRMYRSRRPLVSGLATDMTRASRTGGKLSFAVTSFVLKLNAGTNVAVCLKVRYLKLARLSCKVSHHTGIDLISRNRRSRSNAIAYSEFRCRQMAHLSRLDLEMS